MKIISHFQDAAQTRHRGVEPYSLQEVRLTPDMNIEYTRGFYVHHNGDLIGIVATAEGPVFFHNQDKYLLQEGSYSFLLQKKNTENIFFFEWQGACALKISYTPVLINHGGRWVDDPVWDFFSWLTKAVRKKRFAGYYTVDEISSLLGNREKAAPGQTLVQMRA